MAEGQYWLETTDSENFYLGDALADRDPNEEEEKALQNAFLEEFSTYEEMMEAEIVNPNDDTKIAATSPLIKAKERLAPAEWRVVNDLEWSVRDLGSFMIFQSIQTEHHGSKQEMASLGKEGRVHLYFFPRGYVERAMIHVAFRKDDEEIDTEQKPYTVLTNPYEGTADVKPGYEEIDVRGDG
jgi:hypothetical protein